MEDRSKYANIPIPLPQKTRKNGFDYVHVHRGKKAAIYAQRVSENVIYYEVTIIRIRPGRFIKEKWIEARESFPSNEDFGYHAWTYQNFEKAKERFEDIEKNDL